MPDPHDIHLTAVPDVPDVPQPSEPATPVPRRSVARIAPHAARHANRARRTWVALLFYPFFAIYLIVDAVRDLRDHLSRERSEDLQRRPPFERPASMPGRDDRSMGDIVRVVESFPFQPAPISTSVAFYRDNGPDAIGALLSSNPQMTTLPHLYPARFEHRLFEGHDGAQLSGMQAMHDHAGPALLISHGMLMTKNFDLIIQIARRAYEEWGFHVVTIDLRGWGQSAWTTEEPSSAGFFEGHDIVEICRALHLDPRVTSVGGLGYSLGGASMLNAAAVSSSSADTPLDGGIVTVSAPVDVAVALEHISTKPHWRDPYYGLWHVFRAAIKAKVRRHGLSPTLTTWRDIVEAVSAPHYGVSLEKFCTRASATTFAADIRHPVLALHAGDDFLVPVHHAYQLRDAAADNEYVHVMVRDSGAHCSFVAVDASWFHSSVRRWLEYWATPGDLRVEAEDPAEDVEAGVG